jgi:hypothetical protein
MKTKNLILTLTAIFFGIIPIFGQGFQPPTQGKAVVYFARVTKWGGSVGFEYFHQDKYIGTFKGAKFLRYECNPGKQLFWVSSENKEFITAELVEGGTYIAIVDIEMGAWKARVGLTPISANEVEIFQRAKQLILKSAPVITPNDKIEQMNEKLKPFIAEKLKMYNEVWKNEKNFKHISPEMAIPVDAMK